MNDTLYLINGSWLTYEEAHNLGYTLQKPNILTFYSTYLVETPVIQDTSDNTFYDSVNQQWVSDIDDLNLYKIVGDLILFVGEIQHTFVSYSSSAFSDEASHVYIDNSFASIEYLHDSGGYTLNQCVDYIVDEGERLVWYDPNTELYWDNRDGRKLWVDTPPVISKSELQDVFIMTNDTRAYLLPQWEDDLSQMAMRYRVSSFDEQDTLIDSQQSMKTGFYSSFNFSEFSTISEFYIDTTELGKTFYVYTEEGVDDYQGVHHNQGDTFVGDYKVVYVDSDQDVVFYKGQTRHLLGQSHDMENPVLYWCEDAYRTPAELFNMGYTETPSDEGLFASDTNVEFEIDDIYHVMHNKTYGYYCEDVWYSTIQDLNNAGYYLVEKITQIVRPSNGTYCSVEANITKNSTSFNTSNYKVSLRLDDDSDYIMWDGHNWFLDPDDSKDFEYSQMWADFPFVTDISRMPSTTVNSYSNATNLFTPITVSGNPINKFVNSELGTRLYLYLCCNYSSSYSIYSSYFQRVRIAYWKLI